MPVDSCCNPPERVREELQQTPCFSREESEIFSSYTQSRVGEPHGDRMLGWCTSPQFASLNVGYNKIRTLSKAAIKQYIPDGIQSEDFTQPWKVHSA